MCKKCYREKWTKENPNYRKIWRKENNIKENERTKIWRKNNPKKYKESAKKSRNKLRKLYPERYREYDNKKYKKFYKKIRKRTRKWYNKKARTDIRFKLRHLISTLVCKRLHSRLSSKNGKSTFSFLPYTIDDLIQHLEKQFEPWMNWENYGKWHIDHIRPDCKFDYKNVEDKEFQKCWALENLRPLEAIENIKKGGKLIN